MRGHITFSVVLLLLLYLSFSHTIIGPFALLRQSTKITASIICTIRFGINGDESGWGIHLLISAF